MPYDFSKASVLVVDDMTPMISLTRSILNVLGFKNVYGATNGEDAFKIFCEHSPDLVITDWVMEPMDGIELVEKIRKDPLSPNKYTSVIMMTGYSLKDKVEMARDTGVTEFLAKPFTARDMYKRIAQIIENPRQFVDTPEFFGPDRRRRKQDGFGGNMKRHDDKKTDEQNILDKLRQEAKGV